MILGRSVPILSCDVKMVENIDMMVHTFANWPLSLHKSNEMADIFKKAMKQVMCVPGDQHAGLSIVEVIHVPSHGVGCEMECEQGSREVKRVKCVKCEIA